MLYLNDNVLIHLTKYINISEYKNFILICKYFHDTVKKYEKNVLFELINNKEDYEFTVFEKYQRIKVTKKNNSICYTFPKDISVKSIFEELNSKYNNLNKTL